MLSRETADKRISVVISSLDQMCKVLLYFLYVLSKVHVPPLGVSIVWPNLISILSQLKRFSFPSLLFCRLDEILYDLASFIRRDTATFYADMEYANILCFDNKTVNFYWVEIQIKEITFAQVFWIWSMVIYVNI